jgi:hypothetical protein
MATDERARVALYERLDETLGSGAADTLMGYPPPVGWADVATKHDLTALEERLQLRMDARFFDMEARFERAIRHQTATLFSGLVASVGLTVGLMQLFG